MTSLNTFGAIMTFAIELEAQLEQYYQTIGDRTRADEAARRRANLERVRRENITEIKLEPIEGLDENSYRLPLNDVTAEGKRRVEKIAAQFYADVAPKINVREAQRALERCARQHGELANV